MRLFVAGLCVLLLAGCTAVIMKEPFPETRLTGEEQGQLEGVWQFDDAVWHIAFSTNGVPWVAAMRWADEDFQVAKFRLYFTKHNDSLYLCMPTESGETNSYIFVEYAEDDGKALLWVPAEDVFEKWIEDGTLAGVEKDGSIMLESPATEILEFISTHSAAFNYKEPMLLRKLR